jgi:hypothetical protein
MRYLLLLHGDETAETALSAEQRREIVDRHVGLSRELRDAGQLVLGEPLGPSAQATIVRNGTVSDGPFAETKEQLGGFYLVDCPDIDAAVAIARRIPGSPGLAVEVRPIPDM